MTLCGLELRMRRECAKGVPTVPRQCVFVDGDGIRWHHPMPNTNQHLSRVPISHHPQQHKEPVLPASWLKWERVQKSHISYISKRQPFSQFKKKNQKREKKKTKKKSTQYFSSRVYQWLCIKLWKSFKFSFHNVCSLRHSWIILSSFPLTVSFTKLSDFSRQSQFKHERKIFIRFCFFFLLKRKKCFFFSFFSIPRMFSSLVFQHAIASRLGFVSSRTNQRCRI